jgi:hypothetical protein
MAWLARLALVGIPSFLVRLNLLPMGAINKLAPDAQRVVKQWGFRRKTLLTIAREFEALEQSAAQVRSTGSLGDLPLVVVRRGKPGLVASGVSAEMAEQIEQVAGAVHDDLPRLSTRGSVITATDSGYETHIEQPALVVAAIQQVVAMAREGNAK